MRYRAARRSFASVERASGRDLEAQARRRDAHGIFLLILSIDTRPTGVAWGRSIFWGRCVPGLGSRQARASAGGPPAGRNQSPRRAPRAPASRGGGAPARSHPWPAPTRTTTRSSPAWMRGGRRPLSGTSAPPSTAGDAVWTPPGGSTGTAHFTAWQSARRRAVAKPLILHGEPDTMLCALHGQAPCRPSKNAISLSSTLPKRLKPHGDCPPTNSRSGRAFALDELREGV